MGFKIKDMFTGEIRDIGRGRKKAVIRFAKSPKQRKSECRCHHPTYVMGACTYRTCRHEEANHYGTILEHENDKIPEGDKILTNVEPEIKKHPEHFRELGELIEWVNEGLAKCFCGYPVRRQDLRYYTDHDGGLSIPYEDTKCWVWTHCPNCGFDYSFPKILRQKEWRKREIAGTP